MVTNLVIHAQQWLAYFELANPWVHPGWFLSDIALMTSWLLEDYIFISPVFWVALMLVLPFYIISRFIKADTRFLMLGRGRQDPGALGMWTHTFLEFFILRVMRFDVLSAPFIHPFTEPYNGRLPLLPQREGPRPRIIGVDPFRQDTGNNQQAMAHIMRVFQALQDSRPQEYQIAYRADSDLPFLKNRLPDLPLRDRLDTTREWEDEIAHVRHCGAMAVNLHPSDAAEVIRSGWGQRHPLAAIHDIALWKSFYHTILRTSTPVSPYCVIVYAHTNDEQFHVGVSILTAAVWWQPLW